MALKNSNIYTIDKYLKDKYYIPNYQREYSWEEGELTDFWDDLERVIKDEDTDSKHFFGQIVIHDDSKTKRKYIIDGQQRTISSTIFLRVLQLAFRKINADYGIEKADQYSAKISSSYICDIDEFNLNLGESDGGYFRENIQDGNPANAPTDRSKSHGRMRKAFIFFDNKITEAMQDAANGQEKMDILIKYFDAFTQRFEVLCMEATELSEAFIIFETLNARGRDLETADLLKNFIFSRIDDIDIAQRKWNEMLESLDKADATKFIRHYWNSCHSFAREKELYKKINKEVSSPRESGLLLDDLVKLAPTYHDLSYPKESINAFSSESIYDKLIVLETLKASTYYPVILAMRKTKGFDDSKSIEKVLDTIILYVFRNFTICNKVANTAEIFFAKTAKDIFGQEFKTVEDVIATIKHEIVDDEEFKASFQMWSATNSTKEIARYILRQIHYHLDEYNELNVNNMEVHIEHIMPQDNSQWHIDEETHDKFLWRLGNLALLSGTKNISISNDLFDKKKEVYKDSKIAPNTELAKLDYWGPDQIEDRQAELADYAVRIWKK